jgi:hypothetical protein
MARCNGETESRNVVASAVRSPKARRLSRKTRASIARNETNATACKLSKRAPPRRTASVSTRMVVSRSGLGK